MGLECLLLCRDQEAIRVLQPALVKLYIAVEVCSEARYGQEILAPEKYDAVVIDCDDLKGGLEVLQRLRKGTSNKNSDRKSTRLNSSHVKISYAVFCLKKKKPTVAANSKATTPPDSTKHSSQSCTG